MEYQIKIDKSFEGEFRAILRHDEIDIITMPWVVGESMAWKQLGLILQRAHADVLYACRNNAPFKIDAINQILNRKF